MPASKAKAQGADSPAKDAGIQYVKCDLTEEQKRDVAMFSETLKAESVLKWMAEHVLSGHVVSCRSNEVGFQCSVTGTRASSGHEGKCLIGRASTATKALHSTMYKDTVVLHGSWDKVQTRDELDF